MTTIIFNTLRLRPSRRAYLIGASEAFNLQGSTLRHYHLHESPDEADLAAMQNDWQAVGEDLTSAFSTAKV